MAEPAPEVLDGQVVYEHWSPPRPAQPVPQQAQQQQWTTSLPFHDYSMQWEGQDSSTEQAWIADEQGMENFSPWTQQQQWTSSYSTQSHGQHLASSAAGTNAFAPAPVESLGLPLPYAEHHQHTQESTPSYHPTSHHSSHVLADDPRFLSQHLDTDPFSQTALAEEGQRMEGMDSEGWTGDEQYVTAWDYYPMDTAPADAGHTSVASSPNDQFVFGVRRAQQSYDHSPHHQGFPVDDHSVPYHHQYEQYAYTPAAPILSPTSTSSLSLHTPSSSLSSFAYSSNPTSPAYSQFPKSRSRQHSLDSAPPSASGRPQPLRRLSQSGASSRPFAPYPHPYAPPPPGRPTLTSSRSASSLPNSRRGSAASLGPRPSSSHQQQQRATSPSLVRHPRRRASQPSLSIATYPAAPAMRRPSASLSSSPITSRFAPSPSPFPPSANAARTTFPPETIREKPPPPCSMFDAPLVRRFGGGARGGGNQRPEEVLSRETVGLGMEMGGLSEDVSGESQEKQSEEERMEWSYAPPMDEELLEDTLAFLAAPNKLAMGERSVLIFSPKLIHPSSSGEPTTLFPQPTCLLLGLPWPTPASSQNPAARESPLLTPPHLYLSTTLRGILLKPRTPSKWMAEDGELLHEADVGEDCAKGMPILAGRVMGRKVEAAWEGGEEKKRVNVAVVLDGVAGLEERLLGVFPGSEMKFQGAEEGGEIIHHGSLIAISNRMKSSTGFPRFLAVSGSASTCPAIDWRAKTGGTPRPYKLARSEFTTRSNAWDSFVVYAVDPERKEREESGGVEREKMRAVRAGYPAPPPGALPFDPMAPSAMHYNQPIVLQCMSTTVVSPVLIIRRHHSQSLVIGGGSLASHDLPSHSSTSSLPHRPNETLGVPVSSHLPLAFEFLADPNGGGLGGADTFLEGMEGIVAHRQAIGGRIYVDPEEAEPVTAPTTLAQVRRSRALGPSASQPLAGGGGPTSMYSRGSIGAQPGARAALDSAARVGGPAGGGGEGARRRVQSMSSCVPVMGEKSDDSPSGEKERDTWMIDCGDSCIWSIVPVDVARHTFFIPQSILQPRPVDIVFSNAKHSTRSSAILPATSLGPAIPTIFEYDVPTASSPWITLYGKNFSSNLSIWFSTYRSPSYILRSSSVILIPPPPRDVPSTPLPRGVAEGKRIAIGREDGVLWMTNVLYREEGM